MAKTNIEWAHYTFNPWRGCTKVSEGCKHCYAETLSKRNPATLGEWGPKGKRAMAAESYWKLPVKWNAEAEKAGERRRVFCASLADVFEDGPELVEPRTRLFDLIRQTPHLDWLLLTKRPENIINAISTSLIAAEGGDPNDNEYFVKHGESWPESELGWWLNDWTGKNPPSNVWLGTSVENQQTAEERVPHLLRVPAVVRFLSMEPLLGPVDLDRPRCQYCAEICEDGDGYSPPWCSGCDSEAVYGHWLDACADATQAGINWVIVGGESGPGARPMHPAWTRSLRDQCQAEGVSFLFKQWGEWVPVCDIAPEVEDKCYKPAPESDPERTRERLVESVVMHDDGSLHEIRSGAFQQGKTPMQVFKVGKKKAGRLLAGRTWDECPS